MKELGMIREDNQMKLIAIFLGIFSSLIRLGLMAIFYGENRITAAGYAPASNGGRVPAYFDLISAMLVKPGQIASWIQLTGGGRLSGGVRRKRGC